MQIPWILKTKTITFEMLKSMAARLYFLGSLLYSWRLYVIFRNYSLQKKWYIFVLVAFWHTILLLDSVDWDLALCQPFFYFLVNLKNYSNNSPIFIDNNQLNLYWKLVAACTFVSIVILCWDLNSIMSLMLSKDCKYSHVLWATYLVSCDNALRFKANFHSKS